MSSFSVLLSVMLVLFAVVAFGPPMSAGKTVVRRPAAAAATEEEMDIKVELLVFPPIIIIFVVSSSFLLSRPIESLAIDPAEAPGSVVVVAAAAEVTVQNKLTSAKAAVANNCILFTDPPLIDVEAFRQFIVLPHWTSATPPIASPASGEELDVLLCIFKRWHAHTRSQVTSNADNQLDYSLCSN